MILDLLAHLGRHGLASLQRLGRGHLLLLEILVGSLALVRRLRLLLVQVYSVGVRSLVIVVVSGLFVGMVLGLQGHLCALPVRR